MSSLIATTPQLPSGMGPLQRTPMAERSRPREILGVVMQRLWPALAVGAAVLAVIMVILLTMPRTYVATGSLVIEPSRVNLASSSEPPQSGLPPDTSAIDTQVEVLKSPALAQRVVERLKLYDDPEFSSGLAATPAGATPSRRVLAAVTQNVLRDLRVKRDGLTYVVEVGFASRSPAKAELLANTYMDSYLRQQLDQKIAEVSKANRELNSQVAPLREAAESTAAQVAQYKLDHGLFSAEGATMAEQEVTTLNQQIAQAKADAAGQQARLDAAMQQVRQGSGGADVSAAVNSETIMRLRQNEADASEKLAQLTTQFKPAYPQVQRAQAQLNDIRAAIQAELNRILSSVRAESQAATQRENSLLASLGAAQGGLVANGQAEVGLVALQQRADAAKQVYQAYLDRAKDVAAEGSLQQPDALIDSQAGLPLKPASPNMRLGAALAVLLGLMASACTIFITELWDRRLRSRTDVEEWLGVPFAGVVPLVQVKPGPGRRRDQLVADELLTNRYSGFAESFRNLQAFLTFRSPRPEAKLLGITSSLPREGKTITALSLARSLALAGSRVLIIDCDLRRRGLSKIIGHGSAGLVEVICGKAKLEEALVRDNPSGAWVLPTTSADQAPHDLFSDRRVDRLFHDLGPHFDHIILELPPVLGLADARVLAAKADRVLYVIQWNRTPTRAAQSGLDVLHELGADVAGVILTQVNAKQQARYGYCDSSDYFSYFKEYYLPAGGR